MTIRKSDFLVLGSGIGGLVFALRAAEAGPVTILTKKGSVETNTNLAQGGIAAVMGPDDSPEIHIRDTIACGDRCGHSVDRRDRGQQLVEFLPRRGHGEAIRFEEAPDSANRPKS